MNINIWLSWAFITVYFIVFFVIGTKLKDNSVVDSGWGAGFLLVAWFELFISRNFDPVSLLLVALVSVWGGRLTKHIFSRNRKKGEDPRYVKMREKWGNHPVINAFFQVYLLQALMMILVSIAYVKALSVPGKQISILTIIGLVIWLIGFYFEAVGDRQLRQFLANPQNRGKVLDTGLWRYTRHPNYFGEATMWWGIFLIAFASTGNWLLIISPITITILVRFISGVPLLEVTMMKDPEYQEYAKKTNTFIPFLPHK